MKRVYTTGDKIWVYDCPCSPRFATILSKMDEIDAYHVEHKNGRDKVRVYTESHIYKYPEDRMRLLSSLKDDSYHLGKMANEFEESINNNNPNNEFIWSD
jgi:hypothetical protein